MDGLTRALAAANIKGREAEAEAACATLHVTRDEDLKGFEKAIVAKFDLPVVKSERLLEELVAITGSKGKITGNRRECPTCMHSWIDKYGKNECPKCLQPLRPDTPGIPKEGGYGPREPGEAATYKMPAGSTMQSEKGECPKGGPHTFKFGKCTKCGKGEGSEANDKRAGDKLGECAKGGKHVYKFGKCTKCGALENAKISAGK